MSTTNKLLFKFTRSRNCNRCKLIKIIITSRSPTYNIEYTITRHCVSLKEIHLNTLIINYAALLYTATAFPAKAAFYIIIIKLEITSREILRTFHSSVQNPRGVLFNVLIWIIAVPDLHVKIETVLAFVIQAAGKSCLLRVFWRDGVMVFHCQNYPYHKKVRTETFKFFLFNLKNLIAYWII